MNEAQEKTPDFLRQKDGKCLVITKEVITAAQDLYWIDKSIEVSNGHIKHLHNAIKNKKGSAESHGCNGLSSTIKDVHHRAIVVDELEGGNKFPDGYCAEL